MISHKALCWHPLDGQAVRCDLCRFCCRIEPGCRGRCGVRENRAGNLVALTYGRAIARAIDPIEKKPLYHVLPGSLTASIATRGCNFSCRHCQNAELAQWVAGTGSGNALSRHTHGQRVADWQPDEVPVTPPATLVDAAVAGGCRGMAYTYTEPTVFFEYALDTARLAASRGLRNYFISNGYLSAVALREIAPMLDAVNIDLKFFRNALYREICGARLQPVLDTLALAHALGIWIEITTLIIPGYNDDARQLSEIAAFIADLDPDIPWHVTGFYPCHQLVEPAPTDADTLRRARRIGLEAGLRHVYTGNRPDEDGSTTWCAGCGAALVRRTGMQAKEIAISPDGACRRCGRHTAGIWG